MTVAEAFRTAFGALLKARYGGKGVQLTQATGLSSGTVARLLNGQRGASFDVLEKLRVAFGISAAELFDPDAALRNIGLSRVRITDTTEPLAHTYAGHEGGPLLPSSVSPVSEVLMHQYPDAELLTPLLTYWTEMSPEARLEFVGHGRRLRDASKVAPKVVPNHQRHA